MIKINGKVFLVCLMSWRPLSDNDVSSLDDHRHSVGVEQLTVSLPDLSELELEIPENLKEVRKINAIFRIFIRCTNNYVPVLVEHLDPVVVGVCHDDLVVLGNSNSAGLGELSL